MLKLGLLGLIFVTSFGKASANTMKPFVIGGSETKNPQALTVTVGIKPNQNAMEGLCTGTYIGNGKVLTAAHCTVHLKKTLSTAQVIFILPNGKQESCSISQAIPYPDFSGSAEDPKTTWWLDIAVLKIACKTFDLSQIKLLTLLLLRLQSTGILLWLWVTG